MNYNAVKAVPRNLYLDAATTAKQQEQADKACKFSCGKCAPFGPATKPSTRRLVVHVANDRIGSGGFDASRIKLELISFADGHKHELSFTPVESIVKANSGAVVYSQPVADVLKQTTACSATCKGRGQPRPSQKDTKPRNPRSP